MTQRTLKQYFDQHDSHQVEIVPTPHLPHYAALRCSCRPGLHLKWLSREECVSLGLNLPKKTPQKTSRKKTPTWQTYIQKTQSQPSKKTDAAFRFSKPVTVTQSRQGMNNRLLCQGIVITGIHTGKYLYNLSTPTLEQLLLQATNSQDITTLRTYIGKRTGPKPGAPAE
jgi:hypothetical protein